MSLDVYLKLPGQGGSPVREAIFIREDGQTKEITRDTWDRLHPGREPVTVTVGGDEEGAVYRGNITHNLGAMATEAELYHVLWRPEECGLTHARQLVAPIQAGLARLVAEPAKFKAMNPRNGWGDYYGLLRFTVDYLEACQKYPDAEVSVWR